MKIGLLGYGNVGRSVDNSIHQNINEKFEIIKILTRNKIDDERNLNDFDEFKSYKYDIVVEAIGGVYPAYDYISFFLKNGIDVVTANKELIYEKGEQLLHIAQSTGAKLKFSSAVGGGMPILEILERNFKHEIISKIDAILNGTTNFILSSCYEYDTDIDTELDNAKIFGYAEADPKDDVMGYDVARKLSIIASLVTKKKYTYCTKDIIGIMDISKEDIAISKRLGMKIKLVGSIRFLKEGINFKVRPMFVTNKSNLFFIDGAKNTCTIMSNMLSETTISGEGAGGNPTASSIISDIYNIIDNENSNIYWSDEKIKDCNEIKHRYIVRSKDDFQAKKVGILGEHNYYIVHTTEEEIKKLSIKHEIDWKYEILGDVC